MREHGFTLVEMIVVIIITGIIGSVVAVFIQAPVQGYVDSARRAELTDIADTAFRRVGRDLRLALPNSVRVTTGTCPSGTGSCNFLEFIPIKGGGRYRVGESGGATTCAATGGVAGELLDFDHADACFEVLGPVPSFAAGDHIVIYNMTANPLDPNPNAYVGGNRAAYSSGTNPVTLAAAKIFPLDSPSHRFHVVTSPASYVCDLTLGELKRYSYAWGATPSGTGNLLATHVSSCSFTYDSNVVAQRSGLVTMRLGITQDGETVTLYSATHVSNQP